MQETIQSFTDYLQTEKKASKNTEVSYQRDLRKLAVFLKEHGIEKPEQMNATVLNSYLSIQSSINPVFSRHIAY